ncbi:hypothetical protein [uncultured Jannaschia sp.]|uniref:hypothetical protein n=1 Tax=uncultured Jannaschia sp. TaxID=293347 RepID=UPI00262349DD|nr:hypothetical protein [uncultured Jannaschia sp.]
MPDPDRTGARLHRNHRPDSGQATLVFLRNGPPGMSPGRFNPCEVVMGKGNKRGNKEVKKPKQEKPKVSATANSGAAKPFSLGEKKGK